MKKIFFYCLILFSLTSCLPSSNKGDVPPAIFIKSINVSIDPGNALREFVTVNMNKTANVSVEYWKQGDTTKLYSSTVSGDLQPKFTLLFMEPKSTYEFVIKASQGDQRTTSEVYSFKTRPLPTEFSDYQLHEHSYKFKGYIFMTQRFASPGNLILLNSSAKVVWYQALAANLTATNYDTLSKTFTCMVGGSTSDFFVIDEIATVDLYGNTIFRRNKSTLGNKLYHHDVRLMPDGNYLAVNFVRRPFDLTRWGGTAEEIVSGDGYTIFDRNGTILKEWDCFGTLNPEDDPTIMDAFPALESTVREDWLHANAIEICPDGNYLMSMNMKSQIWKINSKTGQTMWRLGKDGDVVMPNEMISKMNHSCNISKDGDLVFYDNMGGNNGGSRVIKTRVDDATKSATPTMIIDIPKEYSSFYQSSAYMIDNQHVIIGSSASKTILITNTKGDILWRINSDHEFFRAQYIETIKLN